MSKPIRVLNMFTIMNRGGAESMVMTYYRNIDRTKVQFDFLVHRQERGAFDDEIEALGGKIYRMCPIYPQNFHKYKKMLKKFFDEHPEYQIIHSHMSELGYFAFKEAKRHDVPVRICHAHSSPKEFDFKMLVRVYFKIMMRPYISHKFSCGKEAGIWLFGRKNQEKIIQMNNAIDTRKFVYSQEKEKKIRQQLHIEDKAVIGHTGTFKEVKNHMFLIDVFYELQKIEKDAVLVLCGDGELRMKIVEKIKQLDIEDKVFLLGSRSDVDIILQCYDVFLLPSKHEGLSLSIVEAQAAGCKCFISDTIPQECIISDNVYAISLKRSPKDWANIILNSLKNKTQKENMYETIKTAGYDIANNVEWLQNFYLSQYMHKG